MRYDQAVSDSEEQGALDRAQKIATIANILVGIAVTVWMLYDWKKDDPLGWPAQIKRRWAANKRERERRRREQIEQASFAIELALYLERKVEEWRQKA